MLNRLSIGKLCCGPSESTTPLSSALACSSKSKLRQNRLRSARPQARLIRAPSGAWITSCMPPDSSKNRSKTICSLRRHHADGGLLRRDVARRPARRPRSSAPHSLDSQSIGSACEAFESASSDLELESDSGARRSLHSRQIAPQLETSCDSSIVRPGASPSQKGMRRRRAVGIADDRLRRRGRARIRQDVLPSRNTSPARLSMAKSSLTVPTNVPFALGHDAVIGRFGNRAAGGDRRDPRAAAGPQPAVDPIAMQVGAGCVAGRDAFAQHLHDRVEIGSRRDCDTARPGGTASNSSSSSHSSQATAATICWARISSGATGISIAIEPAAPHRAHQGQAFQQLVARQRKQPALGNRARASGPTRPTRCKNVAIDRGEPIWHTRSM